MSDSQSSGHRAWLQLDVLSEFAATSVASRDAAIRRIDNRVGVRALGLGVGEVGVVNAIGPLRGHYLPLVLACLLVGTTVGAVSVALQSLVGILGTGIAILLFVVLGNPASGGPYATTLLPDIWRTIGPYLPTGAGGDLMRNIAYFDGDATGRPLLVLFVWLAAALGFARLSTRTPRLDP
jgi:hypothetical protein